VHAWNKSGCGQISFEISRWKVPFYEIADMVLADGFFDQSSFGIGSGNLRKSFFVIYRMIFPNQKARNKESITVKN
jgi:hypothetical protein